MSCVMNCVMFWRRQHVMDVCMCVCVCVCVCVSLHPLFPHSSFHVASLYVVRVDGVRVCVCVCVCVCCALQFHVIIQTKLVHVTHNFIISMLEYVCILLTIFSVT